MHITIVKLLISIIPPIIDVCPPAVMFAHTMGRCIATATSVRVFYDIKHGSGVVVAYWSEDNHTRETASYQSFPDIVVHSVVGKSLA